MKKRDGAEEVAIVSDLVGMAAKKKQVEGVQLQNFEIMKWFLGFGRFLSGAKSSFRVLI